MLRYRFGSSTVSIPLSINTTNDYLAGSSHLNTAAPQVPSTSPLSGSPFQSFQYRRSKTPLADTQLLLKKSRSCELGAKANVYKVQLKKSTFNKGPNNEPEATDLGIKKV
jgi:hypothetical protein